MSCYASKVSATPVNSFAWHFFDLSFQLACPVFDIDRWGFTDAFGHIVNIRV